MEITSQVEATGNTWQVGVFAAIKWKKGWTVLLFQIQGESTKSEETTHAPPAG